MAVLVISTIGRIFVIPTLRAPSGLLAAVFQTPEAGEKELGGLLDERQREVRKTAASNPLGGWELRKPGLPSLRPILLNIRVVFRDAVLSNRYELEAETWWLQAPH